MATNIVELRPFEYRAVWISDVHLGYKGCKAHMLLDFLKSVNSEYLYLVGDIVDLWSMNRSVHWPQEHNNVVRTILSKAKRGVRVVYIPGNHDELLRDYDGMRFGNVIIRTIDTHTTANGKQYLIMHGDEFDSAVQCNSLLSFIDYRAYDIILEISRSYNHVRRKPGLPYWSFSNFIKHRVHNAMKYINRFEDAVAHEARRQQVVRLIHDGGLRARKGIEAVAYAHEWSATEMATRMAEFYGRTIDACSAAVVLQQAGDGV